MNELNELKQNGMNSDRRDCGWTGIEEDYPISAREVIDITAETGALTTQSRVLELKPYKLPERKKGRWIQVTNGRGGHECDSCHNYAPSYQCGGEYLSDFCPSCGSPMEAGHDGG